MSPLFSTIFIGSPIKDRIVFKILLLTYKALHQAGPVYIKDLFAIYNPTPSLRWASDPLTLVIPRTNLVNYGDKAFSVKAAVEWNKLPLAIRSASPVNSFKSQLKTKLF